MEVFSTLLYDNKMRNISHFVTQEHRSHKKVNGITSNKESDIVMVTYGEQFRSLI